ncbi:MAG: HEAT repeat domain-containing protein [Bacteroidales bacterium]|nr:MAG: HEAT repeat domain-containing protein [Bacteroidales bacterium]
MKDDSNIKRITEYLKGELSNSEAEELIRILKEEGYDLSELDEMKQLYRSLTKIEIPEPRQEMHDGFYRMLNEEKKRSAGRQSFMQNLIEPLRSVFEPVALPRLAYAVLLLLLGVFIGHRIIPDKQVRIQTSMLKEEMENMKKMMALTLFQQSSASDRLKAVSYSAEITEEDNNIIEALLVTLNNDPNVNVRLACLDALTEKVRIPEVREGLVQSITNQDSPLVQIAMADLMIRLQEKGSVDELRYLLEQNNVHETVKEKISESLKLLI